MRASHVTPQAVKWLLHPFIPLGKITLVAGHPGQAKSLFTVWLADYTTAKGASVVMLSAEDDPADTIRPRLEAGGADLSKVEIAAPDMTLRPEQLGALCDEIGGVRLITVDPITAYLPSTVNSWKSQDVRIALEPLRQLAADRALAVVLIHHLNRRADGDPLARIADSSGLPQLARSVMVWGPDPSDPEGDHGSRKALTRVKGNLARSSDDSATFAIVEKKVTGEIVAPYLKRGQDARIVAEDVIADHETRSAQEEAAEWLQAVLSNGPVPAKDIQRQARETGHSDRTLKRAKNKLGVISEQDRDENRIGGWTWRLPPYTSGPLDTLGTVGPLDKGANKAKEANKATYTDEVAA